MKRRFGVGDALDSRTEARGIHKREHGLQPLVGFGDQAADRSIKIQYGGRGGMDAHFMFDGAATDRVAWACRTIAVNQELGYDE